MKRLISSVVLYTLFMVAVGFSIGYLTRDLKTTALPPPAAPAAAATVVKPTPAAVTTSTIPISTPTPTAVDTAASSETLPALDLPATPTITAAFPPATAIRVPLSTAPTVTAGIVVDMVPPPVTMETWTSVTSTFQSTIAEVGDQFVALRDSRTAVAPDVVVTTPTKKQKAKKTKPTPVPKKEKTKRRRAAPTPAPRAAAAEKSDKPWPRPQVPRGYKFAVTIYTTNQFVCPACEKLKAYISDHYDQLYGAGVYWKFETDPAWGAPYFPAVVYSDTNEVDSGQRLYGIKF